MQKAYRCRFYPTPD
ncbi:MAG: hypothetical protein EWV49_02845 [Microcystis aeruginosa Ma_QC_Ch_20071001_S25]|uniref:Transposase putative helix-turn-helix domain-containing protein n=1 Tax=Microcystis aeruginosa Ma_QC_Ch_20071001_S25D TaxID=2486250 RepID=A0A552FQB6_MICAE|nr:MAG: hypothetical protein EWV57_13570 [Microcystis aeruginosa Ma_QC_Ch_20071001_S25D]TRU53720.1 MAG: hypothetical protein EWV49_02845 [Microcystis aeruginosa Ma_QC_Ch_20071001_S25]TRU58412.1 MAG: hypothetical protein EWV90_18870 [Microcystis aeruginosa Ma_QC_Ch_20071001_M135]